MKFLYSFDLNIFYFNIVIIYFYRRLKHIQLMQLKIDSFSNIVFEWIPYNQFNEIKELVKYDSVTKFSATWKDGPLYYYESKNECTRGEFNKRVVLKCLHESQNITDEILN